MILDMTFEQSPWEATAAALRYGSSISAMHLLTLLEGESEEVLEDALQTLDDKRVTLDLTGLQVAAGDGKLAQRLKLEEKLAKSDDMRTSLEENDPLRLYLEELASIPVCGDIRLLAEEMARVNAGETADAGVQQRLTDLSLSRVVELAKAHAGKGVLLIDLIQEGSLGLWSGILAYTGGEDFESFRDWWICQYMARAVARQALDSGVGQKMRALMEAYREADRKLLTRLGRNPVLEEIALELQLKPEEAQQVEQMVTAAKLLEQARKASEPKAPETEEEDQAVENTAYFQSRQRIQELLSQLAQEDARLLTLRFGLEGGMPLSPQETGAKLGLTADEVVAREAAALALLRGN